LPEYLQKKDTKYYEAEKPTFTYQIRILKGKKKILPVTAIKVSKSQPPLTSIFIGEDKFLA
jgi:hypothetical protein